MSTNAVTSEILPHQPPRLRPSMRLLKRVLRIRNSFILVLVLIQVLVLALASLLTRVTLHNIEQSEAEKRNSVTTFVVSATEAASAAVLPAALAISDNHEYARLFAAGDRAGLLAATTELYTQLKATQGIKQFQFTKADFKVFLRVHQPNLMGDDVTNSRPELVQCITQRTPVAGLEQGLSGFGFRGVVPVYYAKAFIGCVELGSDLDPHFLESLDADYPGQWSVVSLERGLSLTADRPIIASLHEPADSPILSADYITPEPALKSILASRPFHDYDKPLEEMALYIPIHNFRGNVAVYIRYLCHTEYYDTVRSILRHAVLISLIGMLLAGLALIVLYRGIRNPVQGLVLETQRIKNFDLKHHTRHHVFLEELETLTSAIADMKMGLQSFQKYVPANLVRQLIDTQQEAHIGGKLKELTVFFSDIASFTAITENLPPSELTRQLSEYFNEVTNIILAHKGTVDKYIGDAVMAFWGAPIDMEDHALMACRAALACDRCICQLSRKWRVEGKYEFHTRIGISTGEIVVGNIGSDQRLNYTVIGDTVNLASRLEGLNKEYATSIIISETTYDSCRQYLEVRLLDFVVVKGKSEPVRIYELIGEKGDISPRQKESLNMFTRAIDAYMAQQWEAALKILHALLERQPDDHVTRLYIARCEAFQQNAPAKDWAGSHTYTHK